MSVTSLPNSPPQTCLDPDQLAGICKEVTFTAGDKLRVKGLLSVDMYLITKGEVEIGVDNASSASVRLTAGRGAPIGEIGFLTGLPATATVIAKTDVSALYIDNAAWRTIEQLMPQTAVAFYRQLSEIAEGRQSYNLLFVENRQRSDTEVATEIVLCRRHDQLLEAQRIRYQIYCEELGRTSPYADPVKRTIADDLDLTGHVLLALQNGAPVGTMRLNMSRDGGLGILEDLYCMTECANHPKNTAISTKFIVKKECRFGQIAFKLMATAVEMAQRYDIKDCFMDCIPPLKPFFVSVGFVQAGPPFLHYENGRSHPLRLDIDRYARRIFRLAGLVVKPAAKGG
ncbi:MAG: cyclic nucleotide-binding domain-containing protein [Hyphomicrobium sp.]